MFTNFVSWLRKRPLVPVVGLLVFDTIAMAYITSFAKSYSYFDLFGAFVFELVAWGFLVLMLQSRGLGRSNAIWDIGSLVLVTVIAILRFKENLVARHYIGIILGIFAISLLL